MGRTSTYPVVHADMTPTQYVGARLKQARIEAGLTINDAADRIGVDRSTVLAWERGSQAPHVDRIAEAARAYGREILLAWGPRC